jgi:hypothetical protein
MRQAFVADASDVFRLVEEYYDAVSVVMRDRREMLMDYLASADCGVWWLTTARMPLAAFCITHVPALVVPAK